MTGRGEGYCVLELPEPNGRRPARGYAGRQGVPLLLSVQAVRALLGLVGAIWPRPASARGTRRLPR